MTTAMLLAAGLGTRLRPLSDELPKPLVPVGDRPAIAHVAARLVAGGVARAVVNVHHLAAAFAPEVLAALPIPLDVVHEPEILGTAGGLANAAALLGDGDVVVWNADILADVDVAALLAAHRNPALLAAHRNGALLAAHGNAVATLAIAPRPAGQGTVGVGARGEVVRLRGERFGDETRGGDFLGVHVVGAALRRRLPVPGCVVGDGYLPALRRGEPIATLDVPGAWDDVGTVASYLAANARWLERRGVVSWTGPSASVASGVGLEGSVVGAGARVEGRGALSGCVVWPGAVARAPLERAVVTPRAVVRA